jgi:hypothetical protein
MCARYMVEMLCVQILLTISVSQVWAACLNPPLSAQSISQFKSNPQGLVVPNSDTRTIEAMTRDLAGTDASVAADLVLVAKGTTPRFQAALAAGLAQAAIACGTVDQQASLLIRQAVASFADGQFQATFAAVAGDLSTAATAAATVSAEASVGSVVVINPGSSRGTATDPGGGGATTFLQLSAPVTTPTSLATTVATTAATPVSPVRQGSHGWGNSAELDRVNVRIFV